MLRRTFGLLAVAALLPAAGCSGAADSAMKDVIADMNAFSDAVEKGEPKEKLEAAFKKYEASTKKLNDMKLSDDEKKRLAEKYKDDLTKAGTRFAAAMMKGMFNGMGMPGGIPTMPGGLSVPTTSRVNNPAPGEPGK